MKTLRLQIPLAKPRNPVVAAWKAGSGNRGAGAHGKSQRALRRAEKIALHKMVASPSNEAT